MPNHSLCEECGLLSCPHDGPRVEMTRSRRYAYDYLVRQAVYYEGERLDRWVEENGDDRVYWPGTDQEALREMLRFGRAWRRADWPEGRIASWDQKPGLFGPKERTRA